MDREGIDLDGKVALITGAGSGIGRATAMRLARSGAIVGLLSKHEDEVSEVADVIGQDGGHALPLVADVSVADQVKTAVDKLVSKWQRIDIVFANAGTNGVWAPIDEIEPHEWDATINVNLKGAFLTLKYAIPYLRKRGGSAIITASIQGTNVFSIAGSTAYACSKAALVAFTKKAALELANDQIRVNVISPGATHSGIHDTIQRRNLGSIRFPIDYPDGTIPLTGGERLSAHDIAELVHFLSSDQAKFITGAEIVIDGGTSLVMG